MKKLKCWNCKKDFDAPVVAPLGGRFCPHCFSEFRCSTCRPFCVIPCSPMNDYLAAQDTPPSSGVKVSAQSEVRHA